MSAGEQPFEAPVSALSAEDVPNLVEVDRKKFAREASNWLKLTSIGP